MAYNFEHYGDMYIEFDGSLDQLNLRIDSILSAKSDKRGAYESGLALYVSENKIRKHGKNLDCSDFLNYKYIVEFDSVKQDNQESIPKDMKKYLDQVFMIVKLLRAEGALVVVNCDFNDLLVKETGWNWSEETPEHP